MSKATRQDIIKSISAGIEYDILQEGEIKPNDSPQFKALVKDNATTMLEKYERSMRPKFWYGVGQSVTANFIWLILIALLTFGLAVSDFDLWGRMIDSIADRLKALQQ